LIQILGINAETLVERGFPRANGARVNARNAAPAHEKGGVRIAEAAFEAGNTAILARLRFTAR